MSKTKGNKIKSGTKARGTLSTGVHLVPKVIVIAVALACGQAYARGAIQGSGLDSQLDGTGVDVVDSSGTATAGASPAGGVKTVTFTGTTERALSSRPVTILNNFGNPNSQTPSLTGTAYKLAVGSAISPITIANQHVRGAGATLLTVPNTAPTGSVTEGLNASFGSNSDTAINNGGSSNLLAAAETNGTVTTVRVDTATAGNETDLVGLNYASDGTDITGLANTSLTGQSIRVG